MTVLITMLWLILLMALALLLVPFSFRAQVRLDPKAAGEGQLAWAGGLLAARFIFQNNTFDFFVRFGSWEKRLTKAPGDSKVEKRTRTKKPNKQRSIRSFKTFISTSLLKEVCHFLNRLQRSLHLKLRLTGEYGTDDPALTGFLAGLLAALNGSRTGLRLHPNFSETVLNLQGEISGRLIPAVLFCQLIGFLLTASVRKIWWSALKTKLSF